MGRGSIRLAECHVQVDEEGEEERVPGIDRAGPSRRLRGSGIAPARQGRGQDRPGGGVRGKPPRRLAGDRDRFVGLAPIQSEEGQVVAPPVPGIGGESGVEGAEDLRPVAPFPEQGQEGEVQVGAVR